MDYIIRISKEINSFFKSRKLAIALIVVLTLIFVLGSIIPQKPSLTKAQYEYWKTQEPTKVLFYEKTGLVDIFSAWYFYFILFLFFLNTLFCTIPMTKKSFRLFSQADNKEKIFKEKTNKIVFIDSSQEKLIKRIKSILRKKRYRFKLSKQEDEVVFIAKKSYIGYFGKPLFHICLLLMILAIAFGRLMRVEGIALVTERTTFANEPQNYFILSQGVLVKNNFQGYKLKLKKFFPAYFDKDDTSRGPAGEVEVYEDDLKQKEHIVTVRKPLKYGNDIIYFDQYGFSIKFNLRDVYGNFESSSFIDLIRDGITNFGAAFDIADTGLVGEAILKNPKIEYIRGKPRWFLPKNPVVDLVIRRGSDVVFKGESEANKEIEFENYRISFSDIRYWCGFNIVNDPTLFWLFSIWWIIVFSLFLMYLVVPRVIGISIKEVSKDEVCVSINGRISGSRVPLKDEIGDILNLIRKSD